MAFDEAFHTWPDLVHRHFPQTERRGIATVVRARFVGTGAAFENFRRRVQRREPLVQLRAEQRERGQSTARRQMARTRVVADENPGLVQDRKSTRLNSSHRCISYAVFCLK